MFLPTIAGEGWIRLIILCLITLTVQFVVGFWWAMPLWFVTLLAFQFFRDPQRTIPQQEGAVVAPAHGRIVSIERSRDPYLDRKAIKISIFMNIFSVHSNRSPVAGVVKGGWYRSGSFINASLDKSSDRNEQNAIWIQTSDGENIVAVQVAGLVARRILCYVTDGQRVRRGQRYGFIRFGSRVDLYLPTGSTVETRLGRWVISGSDIIAFLPSSVDRMNAQTFQT